MPKRAVQNQPTKTRKAQPKPPPTEETTPTAEWDTLWKTILETFLRPFLAFFLAHIELMVDWERSQPYEFLDKELQKLMRDAETGRRYVDKLLKLYLIGGGEIWILIHIEIQGEAEAEFPHRMFIYYARIADAYDAPLISLAILTDEAPDWRPSYYEREFEGTKVRLDFPIIKLLDYRERWEELEASDNPFALLVMAHLKALETQKDVEARYRWKWELLQLLYQKGYSHEMIRLLYTFLDWFMALPTEAERRFDAELTAWEEERNMKHVTSIERYFIEKGQQDILLDQLRLKFSMLPDEVEKQVRQLDQASLKQLSARILTAQTLSDIGLEIGNPATPH